MLAKFVRTFSDMLICNVPVIKSLRIVEKVINDDEISGYAADVIEQIKAGESISHAFSKNSFFPPIMIQMTDVGEKSGNLGEVLDRYAIGMEKDIDIMTKKAVMVIEPLFSILLAFIVGFIALSIYLPMFDMMKATH